MDSLVRDRQRSRDSAAPMWYRTEMDRANSFHGKDLVMVMDKVTAHALTLVFFSSVCIVLPVN
ncbi:hypothetical protein K449DRAFT_380500 [Hypoxylon sp. EC38]|nr:hypothetical protein K449DRAFT_380500 [Hypoxylon sp. EC38]